MIAFATEGHDGVVEVHLKGRFEPGDVPELLADHLRRTAGGDPVLVDLTEVEGVDEPAVRAFLLAVETEFGRDSAMVIHRDLEARRALRAECGWLPVVPDLQHAVTGPFRLMADGKPPLGNVS
jgi:hypothetical protein